MSKKILMADDDIESAETVTTILKALKFEVCHATNGLEAIDMALEEKPDLILLDIGMPTMDGWTTIKWLKTRPEISDIPVIAYTAQVPTDQRQKALDAGFDDLLQKTCGPEELVGTIQKWLAAKS